MFNNTFLARLLLIGLGVIGLYTAMSKISPAEVTLIPCMFHSVTSIPCPGCGMTRACVALVQGKFGTAWDYHPFSFFLVGLAIAAAFFPVWLKNSWTRHSPIIRNWIVIGGIIFCLSIWVIKIYSGLEF